MKIIRVYDAPIKLVWDVWTDPNRVAKWWGPRGFSITTHSKDLKPGGFWDYTMHGPDGVDYPNHTKYFEVEKYQRLVYDHGGHGDRPPLFRVTVNFSETQSKTVMDMTMTFATAEVAEQSKKVIKQAGGNSTWDRLAEYLEFEISGKNNFVINRTFDTSIETMFDVWTDPKHFSKWLPPTGFKMEFIRANIRPGESSFYLMSNDSGLKMYGRFKYLEILKPNRIVYTQQFCDAEENITRHPMAPIWSETMLTTVTLASESETQTRVTINWETYSTDTTTVTKAELDAFIKERAGMTTGWTGSFDKLDEYLF